MTTTTQLSLVLERRPEFERKNTRIGIRKSRHTQLNRDATGGLESSPHISRIDVLKVLTRALADEVDHLTERTGLSEVEELTLQELVRRFEAQLIRSALIRTGGKQRRAARLLGAKVTTLNAKIKRYGITVDDIARR